MKPVELQDGTIIYFQIDESNSAFSSKSLTEEVTSKLEEISNNTSKVISELAGKIKEGLTHIKPTEFEIELGITLGAEGSIIISKAKVEANIVLKAKWISKD